MKVKDIILFAIQEEREDEKFFQQCISSAQSRVVRQVANSIVEQIRQRVSSLSDLLETVGLEDAKVGKAEFEDFVAGHQSKEAQQMVEGDCFTAVVQRLEFSVELYGYFTSLVDNEDCVYFFSTSMNNQKKNLALLKNQRDLEGLSQ